MKSFPTFWHSVCLLNVWPSAAALALKGEVSMSRARHEQTCQINQDTWFLLWLGKREAFVFVELDVSCCELSVRFCDCVSHFVFCLRSQGFVLGTLVSSCVVALRGISEIYQFAFRKLRCVTFADSAMSNRLLALATAARSPR